VCSSDLLIEIDKVVGLQQHVAKLGVAHAAPPTIVIAAVFAAVIFANTPALPKWMFYLAIFTAYVTPFYMMRCWWLTFMGKPRDQHVHDHAHESPLMYIPLVVLAIGTIVASYKGFRYLFADAEGAATDAAMVMAINGTAHTLAIKSAHHWLVFGVGGAFAVGFAIAIAIYGKGLAIADKIKRAMWPIHMLLVNKYYIDEIYDFVWVRGCLVVAHISRFIDTWIVDMTYNIAAALTERIAAFSGNVLDKRILDGFVIEGIAVVSKDMSEVLRTPQTGRIRNYVFFAAAVATVAFVCLVWFGLQPASGTDVVAQVTAP